LEIAGDSQIKEKERGERAIDRLNKNSDKCEVLKKSSSERDQGPLLEERRFIERVN